MAAQIKGMEQLAFKIYRAIINEWNARVFPLANRKKGRFVPVFAGIDAAVIYNLCHLA